MSDSPEFGSLRSIDSGDLGSAHQSLAALAFIRAPALPSVRSPDLKEMNRTDGGAGARMKRKRRHPDHLNQECDPASD